MKKEIYRGFITNDAHVVCNTVKSIVSHLEKSVCINNEQSFDVRIVLSELLQNAIKHGNHLNGKKKVYMNVWMTRNGILNITVRDQGQGFDACKVLDVERGRCDCDVPELRECGRGLQIVKTLCDDMFFNQSGNCITVRKKLL